MLDQHYNTKIIQIKVFKEEVTEKEVDKLYLCGIQAFYKFKTTQGITKVLPGLKMVVENSNYQVETFEFEKEDYLKGISGHIDKDKNFDYLRFKTANNKVYEIGEPPKEKKDKKRLRKVKMDKEDRPICFKVSLNTIQGKIKKDSIILFAS